MDVLRAVRPRARGRRRALLGRVLRPPGGLRGLARGALAAGYKALDAMEQHLAEGRDYFAGAGLTLADIVLYAYARVAPEGGFDLKRYPSIRSWINRVAAEPRHVPIDA